MTATPSLTKTTLEATRRPWFVIAHWRTIVLLLLFSCAAFLVTQNVLDSFPLLLFALFLIFIASQIFWIRRIVDLGERFLPGKPRRVWLVIIADLVYLFVLAYSFPNSYRLPNLVTKAVFWWWFVGSMLAFALIVAFAMADCGVRAARWTCSKVHQAMRRHISAAGPAIADPPLPARRRFLEQTAVLVSATPFVAAGYGLLYGRLDVEITRPRIRLARLPKALEGFRIAQLSDIHISPFTTADYIRHCVAITNGLKPDLIALTGDYTGDYIGWDTTKRGEVVRVLAGLRAPFGVFGCLGNHEYMTETEESITRRFASEQIRILRQERVSIPSRAETLNLIGVDYQQARFSLNDHDGHLVDQYLEGIEKLVIPGEVNILLNHNPNAFDRAGELGIDLMLAGHAHGGQLSLDFLHRGVNLSHLIGALPYTTGWYEKNGAQMYVNRGIGTTGFPIRLGARPEITLLELGRA